MNAQTDPGPDRAAVYLASVSVPKIPGKNEIQDALQEQIRRVVADPRLFHCQLDVEMRDETAVVRGRVHYRQLKLGVERLLERLEAKGDVSRVVVLPEGELGERRFALACMPRTDLRSQPTHDSGRGETVLYGEPLLLLACEDDWLLVHAPVGYLGWLPRESVLVVDRSEWLAWRGNRRAFFLKSAKAEGTSIPDGADLPFEADDTIRRVDGLCVRVAPELYAVHDVNASPLRAKAIDEAERYLGVPYHWGGRSLEGVDCSGFTQLVYERLGFSIARDASQQILFGEVVGAVGWLESLLPGDLLFFSDGLGSISHVGMSAGGTMFIHASSTCGVHYSSLDPNDSDFDEGLAERFVLAKRFIL